MKKLLLLLTVFVSLCLLSSCKSQKEDLSKPKLYVVNLSNYEAYVYCDNSLKTWCNAKANKSIELDCSINIPVAVEVELIAKDGRLITTFRWSGYTFNWDSSYKMTIENNNARMIKI